ncbi:MAG: GNAT family N-acetyltransferase [Fibrella sp.]|nr:GNAT family N-acetyltransferase [Armatimonadota bacterium]
MTDRFILRNTATDADIDIMHRYLSTESYWAKGVPRDVVARSVANSLPFLLDDAETGALVAFARVITDKATFAYLSDVFVLPEYRGRGLGKRLVEGILTDPDLQNLRRFLLFTLDAHGLYAQYGFVPVNYTDRVMERFTPDPYDT